MPKRTAASRAELVAHLRAEGIRDERVLAAVGKVRREAFVQPASRRDAYADRPLPIAEGQAISQPYIVGLMTEALALRPADRVLEIGTGSGYQTAILAELCGRVVSLERHALLAERAALRLRALGYDNVLVQTGDGSMGWAEEAPYEGIIVTAAAPDIPRHLLVQLGEGGRLVIPVGSLDRQSLRLVIKQRGPDHGLSSPLPSDQDGLAMVDLGPCRFVPLVGREGWKAI